MPLTDAVLNTLGTTLDGLITHAQIHTATPNSSGSNEATSSRQAVSLSVDADGDLTLDSALNFTGGAAGGPALFIGFWSASTSGTFRGYFALSGDAAFNAAGEYNVTAGTINGTSTG